ncbi:protein CASC3-like isoform X1 [Argonauta hians]
MAERRRRRRVSEEEEESGEEISHDSNPLPVDNGPSQCVSEDEHLNEAEVSDYESAGEGKKSAQEADKGARDNGDDEDDVNGGDNNDEEEEEEDDDDDDEDEDESEEDSEEESEEDSEEESSCVESEGEYIEGDGIDEERQSGDGEEQPIDDNDKELDDDEDRRNPAYVPRRGAFYEHDTRITEDAEKEQLRLIPKKKLWKDEGKWQHDRFREDQQAPKSREELMVIYGYDILASDQPPAAPPRMNKPQVRKPQQRQQLHDFIDAKWLNQRNSPDVQRKNFRNKRGSRGGSRGRLGDYQDNRRDYLENNEGEYVDNKREYREIRTEATDNQWEQPETRRNCVDNRGDSEEILTSNVVEQKPEEVETKQETTEKWLASNESKEEVKTEECQLIKEPASDRKDTVLLEIKKETVVKREYGESRREYNGGADNTDNRRDCGDNNNTRRNHGDIRRDQPDHRRDYANHRKDHGDNRRDHGDNKRDHGDNRRDHGDNRRDHGDNRKDHGDNRRDHGDNRRDHGDNRRDHGDNRRDHGDNRRDHGDNRRDHGDNRRDHGDNRRDHGDNRRDHGDNRREYGDHRRDYVDNRRDYTDHRRDHGDNRRDQADYRRDHGDNRMDFADHRRDHADNRREHGDNRRDHGDNRRDHTSHRRDHMGSRREFGDSRRDHGDNRRDYGDNRRDYVDNRRDFGENRREYGDNRRNFGNNHSVDNRRDFSDNRREYGDRSYNGEAKPSHSYRNNTRSGPQRQFSNPNPVTYRNDNSDVPKVEPESYGFRKSPETNNNFKSHENRVFKSNFENGHRNIVDKRTTFRNVESNYCHRNNFENKNRTPDRNLSHEEIPDPMAKQKGAVLNNVEFSGSVVTANNSMEKKSYLKDRRIKGITRPHMAAAPVPETVQDTEIPVDNKSDLGINASKTETVSRPKRYSTQRQRNVPEVNYPDQMPVEGTTYYSPNFSQAPPHIFHPDQGPPPHQDAAFQPAMLQPPTPIPYTLQAPARMFGPAPVPVSIGTAPPAMLPPQYLSAGMIYGAPPPPPPHGPYQVPVMPGYQSPPPPSTHSQTSALPEMFRGGTTYYSTDLQQPSPSRSPVRRHKSAIPIIDPQDVKSQKCQSANSESSVSATERSDSQGLSSSDVVAADSSNNGHSKPLIRNSSPSSSTNDSTTATTSNTAAVAAASGGGGGKSLEGSSFSAHKAVELAESCTSEPTPQQPQPVLEAAA